MAYPLKGQYARVTTPYGRRGTSWSCNKDSSGKGVHTGVDLAAPKGTPVYAPCAGQIRHRSYGAAFGNHQFAISPDPGQDFAKGEVFFAHTSTRLPDGAYVTQGQQIALVSDEGNATGPHLHMEYHADTKNQWNCSAHDNPQPVLDLGGVSDGPYVTASVYRSKCGYGEPSNGDSGSDTVSELQSRLNRTTLKGGHDLLIDGNYGDNTDVEVRLWQEQICGDRPDPAGKSFLGPKQFATMFPDAVYTLHDDGDPAIVGSRGDHSTMGVRFKRACKYVTKRVYEEPNWDSDSIAGNGPWTPSYFMLHHTAGLNSLGWICNSGQFGSVRLANFLVDKNGELHICAARKTYHAGKGSGFGIPNDKMNDHSVGVEIESLGKTKDLTDAQILTVSQLATGWFEEFKVTDNKALNHKDWSPTKSDTLYTMTWWRAQFSSWDEPIVTPPPIIEPPPIIDIEPPPIIDIEPPPVIDIEPPPIIQPPPVVIPEPPRTITFPLGIQYHYSGKPSGNMTFGVDYQRLDVKSWAPKADGLTFGMLYANVDGEGEFRTRLIRENPDDATAFQTHYAKAGDNYLLTHVWFEAGEAGRPLHYEFCSMDGTTHTVFTRYAKFVTIPWEVSVVITAAASSLAAARAGVTKLQSWLAGQ